MATPIAPLSLRWRRFRLAETDASDLVSAACYRAPKHVGVHAVVVPELKFRDVERHIFGAHLVERADHATLKDAPKAFNRVRVHRTDHVSVLTVVNRLVREAAQIIAVACPRVSRQQAHFVGHGLVHKIEHGLRGDTLKHARNHVAIALDCANDRRLVGSRAKLPLIPMAVFVFSTNPRLVHFHDATKFLLRRDQPGADFVAHGMGRLVATEAKHALNLKGAHSLLAGEHQMGDPIPVAERLLGILEDRPGKAREPIAVWRTLSALPVKRLVARGVIQVRIATARAMDALRPAARHKVLKASLVVPDRETGLELGRGHLRDWFRALCHDVLPLSLSVGGYCHV
jgi:hypothetical protein